MKSLLCSLRLSLHFCLFFGNLQANLRRQVVHQHTERRPARDRCGLASPSLDCRFYQLYLISRFHAAQEYNSSHSRPFAGWYFAYLNSTKTFFSNFHNLTVTKYIQFSWASKQ